MKRLVIVETHPVQYHAPVWRAATAAGLPLHVVYGGDFSVRGYHDREFGTSFQWDADLLGGYSHEVLRPKAEGGPADYDAVTDAGLWEALERLQPAAVLALGYHHPLDRASLKWARGRGVPLLFRGEVSDVSRPGRAWWKALLRDVMLRRLYQRCAVCLYLGERARQHYTRLGVPAERLVRSPYCVDDTLFQTDETARAQLRTEARRELGVADGAWVVLFSGKLSRRKGVDLLPAALRALPGPVHAVLVGDGERRAALEAAFAAEPAVPASFTGFQNQSALSRWYHAADVLALPSLEGETWGLVVNDGLHHGLPCVVAATVGCAPDLALPGRTGEVFTPGDAADFARALERCRAWASAAPEKARAECRAHVARYSVQEAAAGLVAAWACTVG